MRHAIKFDEGDRSAEMQQFSEPPAVTRRTVICDTGFGNKRPYEGMI